MPRVEITLGNDGSIKAEAFGFEGSSCQDATKFLDELFGEAEETQLKDEFYMKTFSKGCLTNGFCG